MKYKYECFIIIIIIIIIIIYIYIFKKFIKKLVEAIKRFNYIYKYIIDRLLKFYIFKFDGL